MGRAVRRFEFNLLIGVMAGILAGPMMSQRSVGTTLGATKVVTVLLKPYGWMTQRELSVQSTITEEGEHKGWLRTGPEGGVAWSGVGEVVVNGKGQVFVGLPIWATGAAPKSALRGSGNKLRVVVVEAGNPGNANGTAKGNAKQFDWPTDSLGRLDLRLAADDALMVVAGDKLMRVGADGKTLAELAMPNMQKEFEPWNLDSSTSGKSVRVRFNSKTDWIVDAETLKVLKTCVEPDHGSDGGSFTDHLELMSETKGEFPKTTHELERAVFCGKRESLAQFGAIDFTPEILDDGRFLALERKAVSLKKMSGETVWQREAPAGRAFEDYVGSGRVSRDLSRVAVRVLKSVVYAVPQSLDGRRATPQLQRVQLGRERALTKTEEVEEAIEVLDIATGKVVARVPIQEADPDLQYKASAAFSLSPDGKLLAILQDGVLVVWKLN